VFYKIISYFNCQQKVQINIEKMKQYNRRDFIKISALALSTTSLVGLPISCGRKQKSGRENIFKYSLCNECLQELSWPEQCQIIGNAGYTGVEIAPFTLVKEGVKEISDIKRQQMVQDMRNAGIECVGLHWLLSPPPKDLHFTTPDDQLRQRSVDYLDSLIDFCGDLGGKVMIFGSPNQRSTTQGLTVQEAMDYFADGLAQVADHAQKRNVKILVEPLTKDQTNVINTLGEAMKVVNKVNHPAISTMFDFHNTADETEPMDELIRKYYNHIHHIHFQDMDGTLMSPDEIPQQFIRVFQVLKNLNYEKWISVEVFDFSPEGKKIAKECMKTFQEIEKRIS
jgi:sugar phosphate isomerase/epimerase